MQPRDMSNGACPFFREVTASSLGASISWTCASGEVYERPRGGRSLNFFFLFFSSIKSLPGELRGQGGTISKKVSGVIFLEPNLKVE